MSEAEQQQSSTASDSGNAAPPQEPQLALIFPGRRTTRTSRDPNVNEMPKFPQAVPGEVQTAIRTYTPDANSGHYRAQLQGRNPSVITYRGVWLETIPKGKFQLDDKNKTVERSQLFVCLADQKCRNNGTVIKITNRQTSSATTHLLAQHKIKSSRTMAADEK